MIPVHLATPIFILGSGPLWMSAGTRGQASHQPTLHFQPRLWEPSLIYPAISWPIVSFWFSTKPNVSILDWRADLDYSSGEFFCAIPNATWWHTAQKTENAFYFQKLKTQAKDLWKNQGFCTLIKTVKLRGKYVINEYNATSIILFYKAVST